MKDSHGRDIDYLRISLTDRCNLRCIYCMPEEGVCALSHQDILSFEEIVRIVRVAAQMGIKHLRLTGGEPLVRRGVANLVAELNAIDGIESVAITTNGILLSKMAQELKEAGLSRVNISLDTLDSKQYEYITRRDKFNETIDGIHAALDAGFDPVKINSVVVRSLNQDIFAFASMSIDKPLHVRFIEFMPVGEDSELGSCGWGKEDVVPSDELLARINEEGIKAGVGPLYRAQKHTPNGWGPAEYYEFDNALGTVGFISPLSNHFCSTCNRIRLTADGKIRPCLFSDTEYDIRTPARANDAEGIRAVLMEVLGVKPDEHHDRVGTERGMSQIGG